jgi:hypothetical protein
MAPLFHYNASIRNYEHEPDTLRRGLGYFGLHFREARFFRTLASYIPELPNMPIDSSLYPPPDSLPIEVIFTSDTLTFKALKTQTPVCDLIVYWGTDSIYQSDYTDSLGKIICPGFNNSDSVFLITLKPGFREYYHYAYGIHAGNTVLPACDVKVYGDIIVPAGDTLVIRPGCHVQFSPLTDYYKGGEDTTKCEIKVFGHLKVEGTQADSVFFIPAPGDTHKVQWFGIVVENGGSAEISYASIKNAQNGVKVKGNGTLVMNNSTVENASYSVHYNGSNSVIDLTACTFKEKAPLFISYTAHDTSSSVSIKDSRIETSMTLKNLPANNLVKDNLIIFDRSGMAAIFLEYTNDTLFFVGNTVQNIGSSLVGFAAIASTAMIDSCLFYGGEESTIAVVSMNVSYVKMKNTVIDSFDIGVYVANSSDFWAGDTISADSLAGNTIKNCSQYYVVNANDNQNYPGVYAQNVFWGDPAGPDASKFSYTPSSKVYYWPWTGASTCDCRSLNVHCVPLEYSTVSGAVAACASGVVDTVFIFPGTFNEYGINITKEMYIKGSGIDKTTIDAQRAGRIFTNTNALGVSDTVWCKGLRLLRGYDSDNQPYTAGGPGWTVLGSSSASGSIIHLDSVRFEACSSSSNNSGSGALRLMRAGAYITNCEFVNNKSPYIGGAIDVFDQNRGTTIKNSIFSGNNSRFGGGIKLYVKANASVENCLFWNNYASRWGGVLT